MGIEEGETYGHAETMVGDMKKEKTQDAEFFCNAYVVGVLQRNGWTYRSCKDCGRN
ncbi:unnamed protein product, partial [Arabidopsis halleri]